MNPKKQNRRKTSANKLEPIDWREFANDAVLNGNMSTLYRRPPSEDPSAYASPEAMIEIEKRVLRPAQESEPAEPFSQEPESLTPTVGTIPTTELAPSESTPPSEGLGPTEGLIPTVGIRQAGFTSPTPGMGPTVGPTATHRDEPIPATEPRDLPKPTVGLLPNVDRDRTEAPIPTEGSVPTVGSIGKKKVKPIRTIHDALTLAGQVLYSAMLGSPDTTSTSCTKGYRQLAAETHLDKDTVRDLIVEFKQKGILHETATYDPDTRSSKTYEVLSPHAILKAWQESGIFFVTAGRQRPLFCSATGDLLTFIPTVGVKPAGRRGPTVHPSA